MSPYSKITFCILFIAVFTVNRSCDPQSEEPVLEPPFDLTTFEGTDAHFICCGGSKWIYMKSKDAGPREISTYPEEHWPKEFGKPSNIDKSVTVYTMRDDRGRLIVNINDAKLSDTGIYECVRDDKIASATLTVEPPSEIYKNNRTVISNGEIVQVYQPFPLSTSQNKIDVIITCPKNADESIQLWKWRAPKKSELVKPGESFSEMVFQKTPGIHPSRMIEVFDNMYQARVLDPANPNAPRPVYCQIEMKSPYHGSMNKSYFVQINWMVYQTLELQIAMVPPSPEEDRRFLPEAMPTKTSDKILEGHAMKLACEFQLTNIDELTVRNVTWLRAGRPISQPPFFINNTGVQGLGRLVSYLWIAQYRLSEEVDKNSGVYASNRREPVENFTCVIQAGLIKAPSQIVTPSLSFQVGVIRTPKIVLKDALKQTKTENESVHLEAFVIANGRVEQVLQFSQRPTDMRSWRNLTARDSAYKISFNPTSNPMEHKLTIDIYSITREQHGAYRWQVWNEAGSDTVEGNVRVNSQPQIAIWTSLEGYFIPVVPFYASCLISGYPLVGEGHPSQDGDDSAVSLDNMKTPVRLRLMLATQAGNKEVVLTSKFEISRVNYTSNNYSGINATYRVKINEGTKNPSDSYELECSYEDRTGRTKVATLNLERATMPMGYRVEALCAGPNTVVWQYSYPMEASNPRAKLSILNRLKLIKILFSRITDSAENEAAKHIQLDSNGFPNEEFKSRRSANDYLFFMEQLFDNTSYKFEWSFENVLGISDVKQMVVDTAENRLPPKPKSIWFEANDPGQVKMNVIFDDPCPYPAARREMTEILVGYQEAVSDSTPEEGFKVENPRKCQPLTRAADDNLLPWSGEKPFVCTFSLDRADVDYDVFVATKNADGDSGYVHARYYRDPLLRMQAARKYLPPGGRDSSHEQLKGSVVATVLLALLALFVVHL